MGKFRVSSKKVKQIPLDKGAEMRIMSIPRGGKRETEVEDMKRLIIAAVRESYGPEDVRTMTVGELREALEEFDDDARVILSHDSGYTYGGIRYGLMEEEDDEEEEEDDERDD